MTNLEFLGNKLLSGLPRGDLDSLSSNASIVSISQGTVLCEATQRVEAVYFPLEGMISLVVMMKTEKAIETATVGSEGVFGAMSGLGLHTSLVRAIAQLPLRAVRISANRFRDLTSRTPSLRDLSIHYNEVLLTQARISAACNALHQVEARFCRWLLQTCDRSELNELLLTHEFLSQMLGVRRTSVTEVANKMQQAGIISYSRGSIEIIDRPRLESLSCECYETLKQRAPT